MTLKPKPETREIEFNGQTLRYQIADVVNPSDYIPDGKFNPQHIHPFLIHNEFGTLAIVYASHLQDALDIAVDGDKLDSCLVSDADYQEAETEGYADEFARLGNAGEPFDLTYVGAIELPNKQYGSTLHFIAMSGMHGCIPDHCEVFETYADAVADLVQLFELGRTREARLRKNSYLELTPNPIEKANEEFSFGADYCEITECNCDDPSVHSDSN